MNCVNHPDVPVSAYCQNCGKPLCAACVRSVGGMIYCEQCLAARLGIGGVAAAGSAAGSATGIGVQPGVIAAAGPSPATALVLGFIPGVGAMYNGQFVKGMIHVLIFVILMAMANHEGVFGMLVAAWIAYQVFDAYQTAKARRDGLPLPDPFGLNEVGAKMGIPHAGGASAAQGFVGAPVPPPSGAVPPVAAFTNNPYAPYPGVPYPGVPVPPPPAPGYYGRRTPVGAIVLIGLGVLFLLNTLDVFHFDWFGRLWPLLIIGFGAALFIRRTRDLPPPPPPPPGPSSGGSQ